MPRLDQRTTDRILELAFPTDGQRAMNAAEILRQLSIDNAHGESYVITSNERSIQKLIKKVREQETESMNLDRQPWSLLLNEKAGIPFDSILLKLLKVWFQRQVERGQGLPFIPFPVGVAKWAVRLHNMAPSLSEKELLNKARRYLAMERMAALAQQRPDSSRDDLEIAMKGETDQELVRKYEDFYGPEFQIYGEERETEHGKVLEIPVPEDIAEQMLSKRKKRRKRP